MDLTLGQRCWSAGRASRRVDGAVLAALGLKKSAYKFGHGARHKLPGYRMFNSYHCSRYNTNTGRLTEEMFESVFEALSR